VIRRTWPIWLATAGLVIIGLETVLVAPASAALTSATRGGSTLSLESIAVQVLLVGLIVPILGIGLASRSRLAYVAALVIGLVPAASWVYLFAAGDAVARTLTLLLVTPSVLVVVGLLLAWDAFWPPAAEESEPTRPTEGRS
jgi:hypothetical protein